MDASDVAAIVGALGVGSFIGQYLVGAHQRRQLRSEVLTQLTNAETARWASDEPDDPPFVQAIRNLEIAALVAQIPREAIAHYKWLAYPAFWLSRKSYEESGEDQEVGGGIDSKLAEVVRLAASEITKLAWTPWRARLGLKRRLANLQEQAEGIDQPDVWANIKDARRFLI